MCNLQTTLQKQRGENNWKRNFFSYYSLPLENNSHNKQKTPQTFAAFGIWLLPQVDFSIMVGNTVIMFINWNLTSLPRSNVRMNGTGTLCYIFTSRIYHSFFPLSLLLTWKDYGCNPKLFSLHLTHPTSRHMNTYSICYITEQVLCLGPVFIFYVHCSRCCLFKRTKVH